MSFTQIITNDKNLQLIQSNINNALVPLQNAPLTSGLLLSGISLKSGQDNLIPHSLGRTPIVAIASIPNVSTNIWNPDSASLNGQNWSTTMINLWCSNSCIVSVWVS